MRTALVVFSVVFSLSLTACGQVNNPDTGDDEGPADAAPVVQVPLTVTTVGKGVVSSDPAGILCGSNCSKDFDQGTTVTLTAVAAENSTLVGWTGDCAGAATTCTVAMNQARAVTATFKAGYSLAVTVDGTGTVTSKPAGIDCGTACRQGFDEGVPVELTATRGTDALFTGWSGDDDSCDDSKPTCTVTMTRNRTITAKFVALYKLTITTQGTGTVTVKTAAGGVSLTCAAGKTCTQSYVAGTELTLTATPDAGFTFKEWTGACTGGSTTCQLKMIEARAVTAAVVHTYQLKVAVAGNGPDGSQVTIKVEGQADQSCRIANTCIVTYPEGTRVQLVSSGTSSDRSFVGWTGACAGVDEKCDLVMTQDRSPTATFKADFMFTVIPHVNGRGIGLIRASSGGTTVGTCTTSQGQCDLRIPPGLVTITAASVDCVTFQHWTLFSGATPTANPFSFDMTTANAVQAEFAGCP